MSKEENINDCNAFNADNADFLCSNILLMHSDQFVEERRNVKLLISYTDYLLYFIAPHHPHGYIYCNSHNNTPTQINSTKSGPKTNT